MPSKVSLATAVSTADAIGRVGDPWLQATNGPFRAKASPRPATRPRDRVEGVRAETDSDRLQAPVSEAQAALEARIAETTDARLSAIYGSLSARTEAATADMAARLRQEFGTSFAAWKSEVRAEIGDATREAALALVEERAASARKALGKQK